MGMIHVKTLLKKIGYEIGMNLMVAMSPMPIKDPVLKRETKTKIYNIDGGTDGGSDYTFGDDYSGGEDVRQTPKDYILSVPTAPNQPSYIPYVEIPWISIEPPETDNSIRDFDFVKYKYMTLPPSYKTFKFLESSEKPFLYRMLNGEDVILEEDDNMLSNQLPKSTFYTNETNHWSFAAGGFPYMFGVDEDGLYMRYPELPYLGFSSPLNTEATFWAGSDAFPDSLLFGKYVEEDGATVHKAGPPMFNNYVPPFTITEEQNEYIKYIGREDAHSVEVVTEAGYETKNYKIEKVAKNIPIIKKYKDNKTYSPADKTTNSTESLSEADSISGVEQTVSSIERTITETYGGQDARYLVEGYRSGNALWDLTIFPQTRGNGWICWADIVVDEEFPGQPFWQRYRHIRAQSKSSEVPGTSARGWYSFSEADSMPLAKFFSDLTGYQDTRTHEPVLGSAFARRPSTLVAELGPNNPKRHFAVYRNTPPPYTSSPSLMPAIRNNALLRRWVVGNDPFNGNLTTNYDDAYALFKQQWDESNKSTSFEENSAQYGVMRSMIESCIDGDINLYGSTTLLGWVRFLEISKTVDGNYPASGKPWRTGPKVFDTFLREVINAGSWRGYARILWCDVLPLPRLSWDERFPDNRLGITGESTGRAPREKRGLPIGYWDDFFDTYSTGAITNTTYIPPVPPTVSTNTFKTPITISCKNSFRDTDNELQEAEQDEVSLKMTFYYTIKGEETYISQAGSFGSSDEELDARPTYRPILAAGYANTHTLKEDLGVIATGETFLDSEYYSEYSLLVGEDFNSLTEYQKNLLKEIDRANGYTDNRDEVKCVLFKADGEVFKEDTHNITPLAIKEFLSNNIIYKGEYGTLASPLSDVPTSLNGIEVNKSHWISADVMYDIESLSTVVVYTVSENSNILVEINHKILDPQFDETYPIAARTLEEITWSGTLEEFLGDIWDDVKDLGYVPMQDYRFLGTDWPTPSGVIRMASKDMLYKYLTLTSEESLSTNYSTDVGGAEESGVVETEETSPFKTNNLPKFEDKYYISFRPKTRKEKKLINAKECPILPTIINKEDFTEQPKNIFYVEPPQGEWDKENEYIGVMLLEKEENNEFTDNYNINNIISPINHFSYDESYNKKMEILKKKQRTGISKYFFKCNLEPAYGFFVNYNYIYIWSSAPDAIPVQDKWGTFSQAYVTKTKMNQYLSLYVRNEPYLVINNYNNSDSLQIDYTNTFNRVEAIIPIAEYMTNITRTSEENL